MILEDTAIGLDRRFTAIWMRAKCQNGASSYEIAAARSESENRAPGGSR